jgi:hypothetical protein
VKGGHWQRDCHKRKADQQQGSVVTDGQEPKPETAYSTSSMTTGSGSQAIRLVTAQDNFSRVSHFTDLTLHSCPSSPCSTSCGLRVANQISMDGYTKKVKPITVDKNRKTMSDEPCTENEQRSLRAIVGAMAWPANQCDPNLCNLQFASGRSGQPKSD